MKNKTKEIIYAVSRWLIMERCNYCRRILSWNELKKGHLICDNCLLRGNNNEQ